MINYIAAFRSRAQTMRLFQLAKCNNIPCKIINTPHEASIGCGISVCYEPQHHSAMQNIFPRGCFNSFIGWFKMTRSSGNMSVERL